MKLVATWLHASLGSEPARAGEFVRRLDAQGFEGVAVAEHVVGGHADRLRDGERVHTIDTPTTDPFVLLSFIAGVSPRLRLASEVLVLPQRQTLVVAKQAAELDRLSGGRLRLGVGVGRNWMEYEALQQDFSTRGRRLEEQIEVLRRLWTEPLVSFRGEWHELDRVGLNHLPVQQPIPIWMGVFAGSIVDAVVRRAARLADGWLPQLPPGESLTALLARFRSYVADAGRALDDVAIECVANISANDDAAKWVNDAIWFADHGVTHLVARAEAGAVGSEHIDLLCRWHDAVAVRTGG